MGVFCDELELGSTAALNCLSGQNKDRYREKELLLLLALFYSFMQYHLTFPHAGNF
jgi:hypothetical protein